MRRFATQWLEISPGAKIARLWLQIVLYIARIEVDLRLIRHYVMELPLEQLRPCRRPCAQRYSQELIRTPSLHVLFVEEIEQEVFVPLDESLGVDLSVL